MPFLLVRADDTRQINIGTPEEPDLITVPDLSIPGGVSWSAAKLSDKACMITLSRDGASHPMILWGPFTIGPATLFSVVTNSSKVKTWLTAQLGGANVDDFKSAVRGNAALRTRVRNAYQAGRITLVVRLADDSLSTLRFGQDKPAGAVVVGLLPPHVICGQSAMGLFVEGEGPAAMAELADLET